MVFHKTCVVIITGVYLKIVLFDVRPNLFECLSTGNLSDAAAKECLHLRRDPARLHYSPRLTLLRLHSRLRSSSNRYSAHRTQVSGNEPGTRSRRRVHERHRMYCVDIGEDTQRNRHLQVMNMSLMIGLGFETKKISLENTQKGGCWWLETRTRMF